jgi:hypothetical protein
MDRNLVSVLALAGTAAMAVTLAVTAPGSAYADDITVDTTSFTSYKGRAEVRAELLSQPAAFKANAGEWARQHNQQPVATSTSTREQAKAEYKASRDYVNALNREDSGSAWFMTAARRP